MSSSKPEIKIKIELTCLRKIMVGVPPIVYIMHYSEVSWYMKGQYSCVEFFFFFFFINFFRTSLCKICTSIARATRGVCRLLIAVYNPPRQFCCTGVQVLIAVYRNPPTVFCTQRTHFSSYVVFFCQNISDRQVQAPQK